MFVLSLFIIPVNQYRFCQRTELVCVENFSIQTMTFTLIMVSNSLHIQLFSPEIWIQEKVLTTDISFSLKSDFTK